MSNVVWIGSAHGRFCGELAAAIARQITRPDESGAQGQRGCRFYHNSMSTFEQATFVLTELGLLEPCTNDPSETWFCDHALTMNADEMPDYLASTFTDGDERLHMVLSLFVDVVCGYGDLSYKREPFRVPSHLQSALRWLAKFGYAEQDDETYHWTDKIGAAMQEAALWDEQLRPITLWRSRDEIEAEAQTAWRTMPDVIRHAHFSGRPVDVKAFFQVLMRCWRNGEWMPVSQDDWVMFSPDLLDVAIRIVELSEEDG